MEIVLEQDGSARVRVEEHQRYGPQLDRHPVAGVAPILVEAFSRRYWARASRSVEC
jgi:hypothetical protein